MIVYPVLDLMGGVVVHGAGGVRERYRAVRSKLVESASPLEIARAVRATFGFRCLYVADLDAIRDGDRPVARDVIAALVTDGFEILADCGVRTPQRVEELAALGITGVVVGLETIPGPDLLAWAVKRLGDGRVVFSLDCRGGVPVAGLDSSQPPQVAEVAERAYEAGVRRILFLDLLRVGGAAGPVPPETVANLRARLPGCSWLVGGGVRNRSDLVSLAEAGAAGVLVATALHDGSLSRDDITRLASRPEAVAAPERPSSS